MSKGMLMNDKARHSRRRAQKELRRHRAHLNLIEAILRELRWRRAPRSRFTLDILRRRRSKHLRDEGKWADRQQSKWRRSYNRRTLRKKHVAEDEVAKSELTELAYLGPDALMKRSLRTQNRRLPYICLTRIRRRRCAGRARWSRSPGGRGICRRRARRRRG